MTDTDSASAAPAEPRRGRTGGRAGRQAARLATHVEASTYLTRTLKPFEVVSAEGLEIIEHNADSILEEVGVIVRDYPDALELFAAAGADVDGERVRFPRGMCRTIVQATAPAVYTQHARNSAHSV
jgi:trimethylamine---corrinoid protein Co-methyltransferase